LPASLPKHEVIGFSQASLFFKTFQIHRSLDPEKHVLIYTVISLVRSYFLRRTFNRVFERTA